MVTGGRLTNEVTPVQGWFCLRSQQKMEHVAAAHLASLPDVRVFCPRIRYVRATRRGPATVTEALFPGYLFAQFHWQSAFLGVRHAHGVTDIVHFGAEWPIVDEAMIDQLMELVGPEAIRQLPCELRPGEAVRIAGGAFHGLEAVVTRVVPGRKRIAVLMEFLGRSTTVEVDVSTVAREKDQILHGLRLSTQGRGGGGRMRVLR